MRKKLKLIGITLIAFGLLYSFWNIYKWSEGSRTVNAIESKFMERIQKEQQDKGNNMDQDTQDNGNNTDQNTTDTFEGVSTLINNSNKGENIAKLVIPKIGSQYDVFWGTDQRTLSKGVGMYVSKWTTPPNLVGGHTVLSGHRETVFRNLGELEKNDRLTIEYQGEIYSYQISKIWITDADDRTVIVEKDEPTLTLTTCYPFDYIGNAPNRYIIQGKLMK